MSAFQHPRFARMCERISREAEQRGTAEHRDRTLAGLSGRVLEIGAGNGLNFGHYPATVTEVVAVEPENRLRALAEQAAAHVPVRVVAGHADALPVDDDSVDAAVASFVLCSVPDAGALAEIPRVSRPGGELRFFEHVRSARPWTPRRPSSRPGFTIDALDRFSYAPLRWVPAHAHILGRSHASH